MPGRVSAPSGCSTDQVIEFLEHLVFLHPEFDEFVIPVVFSAYFLPKSCAIVMARVRKNFIQWARDFFTMFKRVRFD